MESVLSRKDVVATLLADAAEGASPREVGKAFAPANIALCKYWGKRDQVLNLPVTSSLSVSLGELGTETEICFSRSADEVFLNGVAVDKEQVFAKRLSAFLDLVRPSADTFFSVRTYNSVPTAAGVASSASGFAALTKALNELFDWRLSTEKLSILARLGSGSACRSLHHGFVEWAKGERDDGMDSFASSLSIRWPKFRVGLVKVFEGEKGVSSGEAMQRTVETSPLYRIWPQKVENDLAEIKRGIAVKDFPLIAEVAESNALAMHATMLEAVPPVCYFIDGTREVMEKVWLLREGGLPVYFTIDAGPNVKLLFQDESEEAVAATFPGIQIVAPFD